MPTKKTNKFVSLRLNWTPQTENAGFFVALWNGYYEQEGLDVSLELPTSGVNVTEQISSGENDFGLAEPVNIVLARSKGLPVVEVSQIQHDAYLRYVAKKSNGISSIEDLRGKKASLFFGGGEYEFIAMLHTVGLSREDVNLVPQVLHSMEPFYTDQVELASVTLFNELQQVYAAGYTDEDLTIWSGKDFGVGLVAKGVFTSEKLIAESPQVVQAFVNGSIRGWQYAYKHPEQTCRMFVERYPNLGYEQMLLMLNGFNGLAVYGNGQKYGLGYIDPQYFQTAKEVVDVVGLLESDVSIEACYDTAFWESIPVSFRSIE
jgi:NitT/TauT family transport system substrate-binding protein